MPNTGKISPKTLLHGRYIILRVVGSGGMGSVYQAQDTQVRRPVAVKEMSYQGLTTPEEIQSAKELFRKEAEMLERLSHPNLPRVSDYFDEQDRPYLVMDFIQGETLRQRCERSPQKRLPVGEVLSYGIQLCEVLTYLHQQSPAIVFRDLTPANVMVAPDGHIYLIDFGIARLFKPNQTQDTQLFMSLGFSAPELIDKGRTEPRSDLYSLGATLHYCLTGQTNKLYQPFSPIQLLDQGTSFQINKLIAWLTDHDPRKRPHDASAIIYTLQQMQASLSVPASLHDENNPYVDPDILTERVPLAENWRPRLRAGMQWLWTCVVVLLGLLIIAGGQTGKWFIKPYQAVSWPSSAHLKQRKRPAGGGSTGQPGLVKLGQYAFVAAQSYVQLPFTFVSLLTAAICIYMLTFLHIQLNSVLLFASLILLVLAFFASLNQQESDLKQEQSHYILLAIAIGALIVCSILLLQPDVQNRLAHIALSQIPGMLMLILGGLALLRPNYGFVWIDHVLVILMSIILGYKPLIFFIQGMPLAAYDPANIIIVAALAVIALISLFRLQFEFSMWDRIQVFILVIIYIGLWVYARGPIATQIPLTTYPILFVVLLLVTVITLGPHEKFLFVGRIPLLFLVTLCSLFPPTFADTSSSHAIATMLAKPVSIDQAMGCGSVLLAALLFYQMFMGRRSSAQIVTLTVIITAVACLVLQIAASHDVKPDYPAFLQSIDGLPAFLTTINSFLIVLQAITIGATLLFSLLSLFLHLIASGTRSQHIANGVDGIKKFMQRFIVLSSLLACALLQLGWGSGANELWPMNIAGVDVKLVAIVGALIIVIVLLNKHHILPSYGGYCLAMGVVASLCALIFLGRSDLPLHVLSPLVIPQPPFSLTVTFGYAIAIAAALLWLKDVPGRMDPWVLRLLFGSALLGILLQIFWYDLIIVVPLMLIQTILLVVGLPQRAIKTSPLYVNSVINNWYNLIIVVPLMLIQNILRIVGLQQRAIKTPPVYVNYVSNNPYSYGNPVDEAAFFGRQEELAQILQAVTKPAKQDIFIVGERRTGKTSLLYQLDKRLAMPSIPVYIYLSEYQPQTDALLEQITQKIIQELIERDILESAWKDYPFPFTDFTSKVGEIIQTAKRKIPDLDLVLLLDEADFLLQVKEKKPADIFDEEGESGYQTDERIQSVLRHTLQSQSHLRAVIAGTTELSTYMLKHSSPFFNHFRFVHLKQLSEEETHDLIVKPAEEFKISYSSHAIERIFTLSGGQPYYSQALCYEAFAYALNQQKTVVDDKAVNAAEDKIKNDLFHAFLSGFWQRATQQERDVLITLARKKGKTTAFSHTQVERLLDWQLINQTEKRYEFSAGLFQQWTIMALEKG